MASQAFLTVRGYTVMTFSAYVSNELAIVFSEADKMRLPGKEDPEYEQIEFRSTVGVLRDRLDLMGFSGKAAREFYEKWLDKEIADCHDDDSGYPETDRTFMQDYRRNRLARLQGLGFEEWARTVKLLIDRNIHSYELDDIEEGLLTDNEKRLLRDDDLQLGYPASDPRTFLSAVLHVFSADDVVVLDMTDVVHAGYYEEDENIVGGARNLLVEDYPANQPIIILTEGSTDVAILKLSLECVYPHLTDYFSFFDFHATKAEGGAGRLAETVKAFVAARMGQRIVSVFDNDTAGSEALRGLEKITLPPNIRAIQLPELALGKAYPTLGPGGSILTDVNGLAGGIELYLGEDVLKDPKGGLTFVQWRGYNQSLKQYQGELLGKEQIRERFFERAKSWQTNPASCPDRDWAGLKMIWDTIRTAFAE